MRNVMTASLVALSLCALPVFAQQAPSAMSVSSSEAGKYSAADVVKASVLITAIDAATRTITLKDAKNQSFDVVAGDEVKNFAQMKVGDQVVVAYVRSLTLELRKGGSVRERAESTETASAAPGKKPQAVAATHVRIVANVVAVDPKAKTITLKGPKGNLLELAVKNPDHFKVVKVGDQVEADYTEAVAISVEPAKK